MTTTIGTPLGVTASHRTYVPPTLPTAFLAGRWDAAQLALTDGVAVDTWPDVSGFGRNLTKSSTTAPLFKTNQQNGRPVVRFAGTGNEYMATATAATTYKHIFAVAKFAAATFPDYNGLVTGVGGSQTTDLILIGNGGTTAWYPSGVESATYHKNGVLMNLVAELNTAPMNAFHTMSISRDTGWPIQMQFGLDRTNAGRGWKGDIAEVIAYDSVLTATVRQQVERYLKDKWGTP